MEQDKVNDLIKQSQEFSEQFARCIEDDTLPASQKTKYFLDNQDKLRKVLEALRKIEETGKDTPNQFAEDAGNIIKDIEAAVKKYQQKVLNVNPNIQEEDTIVGLSEDKIKDELENNPVMQQLSSDLMEVKKNKTGAVNSFTELNYCAVCNGMPYLFQAKTPEEVNTTLNDFIDSVSQKQKINSIKLYRMQSEEVPLHTKTIVSI